MASDSLTKLPKMQDFFWYTDLNSSYTEETRTGLCIQSCSQWYWGGDEASKKVLASLLAQFCSIEAFPVLARPVLRSHTSWGAQAGQGFIQLPLLFMLLLLVLLYLRLTLAFHIYLGFYMWVWSANIFFENLHIYFIL